MTMLVAISTRDRIVLLADGKSTDTNDGTVRLDVNKIHEIAPSIIICIAGMYIDDLDVMVKNIKWELARTNIKDLAGVERYLDSYVHSTVWAGKGEENKAKLHILLVGYYKDEPHIIRISNTVRGTKNCSAHVSEVWKDVQKDLLRLMKLKKTEHYDYTSREHTEAEAIAEKLMEKGYEFDPVRVGGNATLCHVFPHAVRRKEPTSDKLKV